MALSPNRYTQSLLPSVPPPSLPTREPTPAKDNSDNDGKNPKLSAEISQLSNRKCFKTVIYGNTIISSALCHNMFSQKI